VTLHAELFARSLQVAPGGVQSPVRAFRSVGGTPIFMQRACGARLVALNDGWTYDCCEPYSLAHDDDTLQTAASALIDAAGEVDTP